MNLKHYLIAAAVALTLASCSSSKTVLPYFEDIVNIEEGDLPYLNYVSTIQPADELAITVGSEQPLATANYNLPFVNPASTDVIATNTAPRSLTYIVDSHGDIDFPVLGRLHVAGLTCEQLRNELIEKISKDVANPTVSVYIVNYFVTVAGEVKLPKAVKVNGTRITLLEAIAEAGDMTEYGERSNVLVIREENGERKFAHLNLNKSDVLSSEFYYLRPNDYVYVAPNNVRKQNSKYNQNNAFKVQVTSTIVSACSVLASLLIALVIRR